LATGWNGAVGPLARNHWYETPPGGVLVCTVNVADCPVVPVWSVGWLVISNGAVAPAGS